jgi:hypothetical protein
MRMHMHLVTPSIRCQTIIYKILHRKPEGEGELTSQVLLILTTKGVKQNQKCYVGRK